MSERVILLSDAESRHLAATGSLFVVRPCKWQECGNVIPLPAEVALDGGGVMAFPGKTPDSWLFHNGIPIRDYEWMVGTHPLGVPGDTLLCKEAWRAELLPDVPYSGAAIRYAADESLRYLEFSEFEAWRKIERTGKWRPASRMPRWAVRHRPVVTEAGVMRVNDVCGADAERLGLNVVAKLPAFPPRGTDLNALIDVVGKQVIAAYWNHRYPKYPYEQSPWGWWASVKTPAPEVG